MTAFVVAAIYCICVVENKRFTFHKKPWSFLYPLAVILLILGCGYCEWLFQCKVCNEHWICFITMLLLIFPVIYLVLTYYVEEEMSKFRWILTTSLKKEYDVFVRIQSTGGRNFESPDFSNELIDLLVDATNRDAKQKVFEEYMIRKLKDTFRHGSVSFYKIHSYVTVCCRELRDFWTVYKDSLFITVICFAIYSVFIIGIYNFR